MFYSCQAQGSCAPSDSQKPSQNKLPAKPPSRISKTARIRAPPAKMLSWLSRSLKDKQLMLRPSLSQAEEQNNGHDLCCDALCLVSFSQHFGTKIAYLDGVCILKIAHAIGLYVQQFGTLISRLQRVCNTWELKYASICIYFAGYYLHLFAAKFR